MRRTLIASLVFAVLMALALPIAATGKPAQDHPQRGRGGSDIVQMPADVHAKINTAGPVADKSAKEPARVGQIRTWLALDSVAGRFYTKSFKLRGKGKHIEVWTAVGIRTAFGKTATDLQFQPGDCRNGVRTTVTQAQIDYLDGQFDNNIFPIESNLFSVPPKRNGIKATATAALGVPNGYYGGDGDDIVVLVDNVRDENFYDMNNTQGFSYIAGFFSSGLNGFFDRNIMTIDAFDWLHRTGQNPPNEPVPGNNCASAPARPNLYEGVFAHEYQHLLLSYIDPAEVTWENEGLSDTAIVLTGYGDPKAPVTDIHFDSHIQCFQGFNGVATPANPNPRPGGPENSLNLWGDQDFDHEAEILCDYGAAYSFLLWLADSYGDAVLTRLHNDNANQGFDAIQAVLDDEDPGVTVSEAVDTWLATMALDRVLDDGATFTGGDHQVARLGATINWDTDDAYDTPGAPPNGGDFVRLRNGSGAYLGAAGVSSIDFQGADHLPALPITWEVDPDPADHTGDPALYSTDADNRNDVIVRDVAVPAGSPQLHFDAAWDLETTFDFGYVQVTTDHGETYTSLQCTDTVDDTDPALGNVGPGFGHGFNGFNATPAFRPQTCDMSAYAGTTVGLAFRYFSDSNTHGAGFWVDNVAIVGSTTLDVSDGSTLSGWQSGTAYNPIEIEGYSVQLVAYDSAHSEAHLFSIPVDSSFHGALSGSDVTAAIGSTADVVSAIVTYHDGTEQVTQYAPYELHVNGVLQPGG